MTPAELRERTQRFAIAITAFCDTLAGDPRTQEVANQLHAAAHSVASNYRAVCRAQTSKMFFSKLCIVVEEADEMQGWLQVLMASGKVSGEQVQKLHTEATELIKIFAASKRTWLLNHPDPSRK